MSSYSLPFSWSLRQSIKILLAYLFKISQPSNIHPCSDILDYSVIGVKQKFCKQNFRRFIIYFQIKYITFVNASFLHILKNLAILISEKTQLKNFTFIYMLTKSKHI